jgi:hypothetical protein
MVIVMELKHSEIYICSSIGKEYLEELEQMFFFNPRQSLVRERVEKHYERYGVAGIRHNGELITMELADVDHAQTLFLMQHADRPILIGVTLYLREDEHLRVLYYALKPAYTLIQEISAELMVYMIDTLKSVGKRIKGVKYIDWCVGQKDILFKI